ncbi:hypothetical protein LCGC14_0889850 [marine sediment metagenome]|uniref:Uncharacterized protein n=1 Tax=marine sediment metagenome TaxID=412755 RepID=A0A0F9PKC9_9ZZZZ
MDNITTYIYWKHKYCPGGSRAPKMIQTNR